MSVENRKREYDRLVENDKKGLKPGLSQDDGALVLEFGQPGKPKPAPASPSSKGGK